MLSIAGAFEIPDVDSKMWSLIHALRDRKCSRLGNLALLSVAVCCSTGRPVFRSSCSI